MHLFGFLEIYILIQPKKYDFPLDFHESNLWSLVKMPTSMLNMDSW